MMMPVCLQGADSRKLETGGAHIGERRGDGNQLLKNTN